VLLFDLGAGSSWRRFDRWVPESDERVLQLCPQARPAAGSWFSGGALRETPCNGTAVVPAVPLELTGGTSIAHDAGVPALHDALDQRLAPFTAAFVGAPLERALTITGPLAVRFTAQTVGTDADWTARIVDIAPGGAARLMARGWLKASHRREDNSKQELFHTHTNPQRVVPGRPYRLAIEVWPTAYRLAPGHRIGVLLGAADTQKVLPTGESAASEILVSPERPATLTVPVRRDAGEPVAEPFAALVKPPASDTEPCRPAIGKARVTTAADGVRAIFEGGRAAAETLTSADRVLARRSVTSGDVVWDGRGADGGSVSDDHYVVRLTAQAGDGVTVRRLAVRRLRGKLRRGPRIDRPPSCGLLRAFSLERPAFGDAPLPVRYVLARRASVRVEVLRGRRVVRRFAVRRRAGGAHRTLISTHGLRSGRHEIRLVARAGRTVVRARLQADRR
jgi:hypothetical protein